MVNVTRPLVVSALAIVVMLWPYAARTDVTHYGTYNLTGTASRVIYQNFATEPQTVFVTACVTSGPAVQLISAVALMIPIGTLGCRGISVELTPGSDIVIFNPTGPLAVGTYQLSIRLPEKK